MRGDKYKEAAAFYEPIVRQNYGDILSVSAAVLGEFVHFMKFSLFYFGKSLFIKRIPKDRLVRINSFQKSLFRIKLKFEKKIIEKHS